MKFRKSGNLKLDRIWRGYFTAVDHTLEPGLIEAVNEESEIMVVQCKVGCLNIRIINGNSPQPGG
jgi:hypothetical protein